jgi:hypothetical protein
LRAKRWPAAWPRERFTGIKTGLAAARSAHARQPCLQLHQLAARHKAYSHAAATEAAGAPHAVQVRGVACRHVHVHDQVHGRQVQPPGVQVGGHKHAHPKRARRVHDGHASPLQHRPCGKRGTAEGRWLSGIAGWRLLRARVVRSASHRM